MICYFYKLFIRFIPVWHFSASSEWLTAHSHLFCSVKIRSFLSFLASNDSHTYHYAYRYDSRGCDKDSRRHEIFMPGDENRVAETTRGEIGLSFSYLLSYLLMSSLPMSLPSSWNSISDKYTSHHNRGQCDFADKCLAFLKPTNCVSSSFTWCMSLGY